MPRHFIMDEFDSFLRLMISYIILFLLSVFNYESNNVNIDATFPILCATFSCSVAVWIRQNEWNSERIDRRDSFQTGHDARFWHTASVWWRPCLSLPSCLIHQRRLQNRVSVTLSSSSQLQVLTQLPSLLLKRAITQQCTMNNEVNGNE